MAFVTTPALRSRDRLEFGRLRADTITSCLGNDHIRGSPRPRLPGCRSGRQSGYRIAAGTRAAPTRPIRRCEQRRSARSQSLANISTRRRRLVASSARAEVLASPRRGDQAAAATRGRGPAKRRWRPTPATTPTGSSHVAGLAAPVWSDVVIAWSGCSKVTSSGRIFDREWWLSVQRSGWSNRADLLDLPDPNFAIVTP
jgi:hypothetical protein